MAKFVLVLLFFTIFVANVQSQIPLNSSSTVEVSSVSSSISSTASTETNTNTASTDEASTRETTNSTMNSTTQASTPSSTSKKKPKKTSTRSSTVPVTTEKETSTVPTTTTTTTTTTTMTSPKVRATTQTGSFKRTTLSVLDPVTGNYTDDGDYEKEGSALSKIEQYQGDTVYTKDGGICGWWNSSTNKYVRPDLKEPPFDLKCLQDFHSRAFAPTCGDPWYAKSKYCAKVKFYRNMQPGLYDHNKEKLLVLLDGCLVCQFYESNAKPMQATVKLRHYYPGGSLFSKCAEVTEIAAKSNVNMGNASVSIIGGLIEKEDNHETETLISADSPYYGSFMLQAELAQRKCQGLFGHDPLEALQNIELVVEHGCKAKTAKNPLVIPLADVLDPSKFKDNLAEIRGLFIDLENGKVRQYSMRDYAFLPQPSKTNDGQIVQSTLKKVTWLNHIDEMEDQSDELF